MSSNVHGKFSNSELTLLGHRFVTEIQQVTGRHFTVQVSVVFLRYDMIYLLTAIGLSPGGSSTVHIYTQTIHRTIQNKQYIVQHNNFGRVRVVPCLD
jgi:hypothetical protein